MPVCMEGFPAARQNLVSCSLMPDVPYNTVARRVEDIMQGDRQFHHAQPACEMARVVGHLLNDFLPKFAADLGQGFEGQSTKVCRQLYIWK